MTPLAIEMMIHYNCGASDYRDGDLSAPAVEELIGLFVLNGLLERVARDDQRGPRYRITDRGRAYVEFLCAVPLPIATWVLPKESV